MNNTPRTTTADCDTTIRQLCGNKLDTVQMCDKCVGDHQAPLRAAGCSPEEVNSWCSNNAGAVCEKKFSCAANTKCCGFAAGGGGCDPAATTQKACSSKYGAGFWRGPASDPGLPGQDNCYGRGTCVRFDAQGGCTGCANPCDKKGYVGLFCSECEGGYACNDPNGDRVDSPDCLPPNKCEIDDNGPRNCNPDTGICVRPGGPPVGPHYPTRISCEAGCTALTSTKFACTKNGCVPSADGPFRATKRLQNGAEYSEECESNCKFGKGLEDSPYGGMRQTFFDRKESALWDNPDNYGCTNFPCTNEEIDALKWVRMASMQNWNTDEGSTLCRPVSGKMMEDKIKYPEGTPTYDTPLDCHNAFGNAGWYCMATAGWCRMDENKHYGSTLESCHRNCFDSGKCFKWNGSECAPISCSEHNGNIETCQDNYASWSCTGAPGYTCEVTKGGAYGPGYDENMRCHEDCKPSSN